MSRLQKLLLNSFISFFITFGNGIIALAQESPDSSFSDIKTMTWVVLIGLPLIAMFQTWKTYTAEPPKDN